MSKETKAIFPIRKDEFESQLAWFFLWLARSPHSFLWRVSLLNSCGFPKTVTKNLPPSLRKDVRVRWQRPAEMDGAWEIQKSGDHHLPSLKLTFLPLKMDGWNRSVSFWVHSLFSGAFAVSFRECTICEILQVMGC